MMEEEVANREVRMQALEDAGKGFEEEADRLKKTVHSTLKALGRRYCLPPEERKSMRTWFC